MYRLDAAAWALASAGITAVEPDPTITGFLRNAGVVGSVLMAGWIVENRIGKKIAVAIEAHTAVEDERLRTTKAEFNGAVRELGAKLDGLHAKLDERPCAAKHGCNCK